VSIPRALESVGVAAAVVHGMVVQLVAASTAEDRRRVARQLDNQINVLLEALDAYRAGIARKPRTAHSGEGVSAP
jgi:type II secretory pathway pseudopilin PulG